MGNGWLRPIDKKKKVTSHASAKPSDQAKPDKKLRLGRLVLWKTIPNIKVQTPNQCLNFKFEIWHCLVLFGLDSPLAHHFALALAFDIFFIPSILFLIFSLPFIIMSVNCEVSKRPLESLLESSAYFRCFQNSRYKRGCLWLSPVPLAWPSLV